MICPRCAKENPGEANFCLACGTELASVAHGTREERKVLTVLFADLVGFTSQAEQMDPEEVRAILRPYHASLREDLERYGGTVEKFIGDAVMALFGAPIAHEDDPERAVRAALAIRERLMSEGRLHVRIGLTTGEALVALDARPQGGEGMAAGDVVNTAARLQGVAPVDGVLVDEATHRATVRAIEYREHAPVAVKGKSVPVPVYEAVAARARLGVDVRQIGQAQLVGRGHEIELLAGALARARTEREPQLVTLVGVPGIGKSRLVWELFQQVEAGNELVAWRQGRSLPYAEGISFWALGEIVKAECGILETDSGDEAAAKLTRAIAASGLERADASWIERHLRPLVGLDPGTELAGDHRDESFAAWRRFLEALADQRPLVLVFEDLQWADDGLLDFVDHLVEWASGVPMLIVGTSRPELLSRRPGWGGGKPNAVTISLSPLAEPETARLVGELIERGVMPIAVRDAVLERAQGNPLYAEEFARLVSESGRIDDVPESVQGIIAARLDGLTRDEKELLLDAAVVGKVFWSGALARMRGRDRMGMEAMLHGLERKEFVRRERRSSVAGETEYAFRHILVRDVAYGQIPRGERAERHVRSAAWIESLGRPADHAELVAQHYLSAIELATAARLPTDAYGPRTARALGDAGDRALALNAFASAARYYRAALELIAFDDRARPALLFRCGKALRVSEEGGADELAEAEALLGAADDRETAGEAAVLQAELAWFAGNGELASEHLARAATLVDGLDPSPSKAYVLSDLARYHMLAGRWAEAIAVGSEALEIAEALGLDETRAHALNSLGVARFSSDVPGGVENLEMAVELADTINSPEAARAMNNLANTLNFLGETERAHDLWRRGLKRAEELGNTSVARFVRAATVEIDFGEGRWDAALESIEELIAEAEGGRGHALESVLRVDRGYIRFARDDADGALQEAERALAAGRRMGDPQALVPALSFKAWLLTETGRGRKAGVLVDELLRQRDAAANLHAELAAAMAALGRQADLEALARGSRGTLWNEMLALVAAGSLGEAAGLCERVGFLPAAAFLRMRGAHRLIAEGVVAGAQDQLARSIAFWRSVQAGRFVREAEALLPRLSGVPPEGEPVRELPERGSPRSEPESPVSRTEP